MQPDQDQQTQPPASPQQPPNRSWQQPPGYQPVQPLFGAQPQQPIMTQQQPVAPSSTVTAQLDAKHQESKSKYPNLHLSQDEYVIAEVRRHPIGIFSIWAVVGIVAIATFAILPLYGLNRESLANTLMIRPDILPSPALIALPLLVLTALFALGGLIATYVYNNNRFYLTNESVIQHIQASLFSRKEQIINLASIEDASYRQKGILQTFLNYGSLRLSTEGEETTYRFQFVANPTYVVRQVTEAMENATGNAARFRKFDPTHPINLEHS